MKRSSAGFTLTEMVIVLAILSCLTVVALPYVNAGKEANDARSVALQIAGLLKQAQVMASRNSRPTSVRISLKGQRQVVVEPGRATVALSDKLAIRVVTAKHGPNSDEAVFTFLPNGESTGGSVTIDAGLASNAISVDWLTGRVSVNENAKQ
jgi:general secretion pathway protein H